MASFDPLLVSRAASSFSMKPESLNREIARYVAAVRDGKSTGETPTTRLAPDSSSADRTTGAGAEATVSQTDIGAPLIAEPSEDIDIKQTYADGTVVTIRVRPDADGVSDIDGAEWDVDRITVQRPNGETITLRPTSGMGSDGSRVEFGWASDPNGIVSTDFNELLPGLDVAWDGGALPTTLDGMKEAFLEVGGPDDRVAQNRLVDVQSSTGLFDPDVRDLMVYQDLTTVPDPNPSDDAKVVSVEQVPSEIPTGTDMGGGFILDATNSTSFKYTFDDGSEMTITVTDDAVAMNRTVSGVPVTAEWLAGRMVADFVKLPPEMRDAMLAGKTFYIHDLPDSGARVSKFSQDSPSFLAFDVATLVDTFDSDGTDMNGYNIWIHEAGHILHIDVTGNLATSLPGWAEAVARDDGAYVSGYSQTSEWEDVAEHFALWYAVRTGRVTGAEAERLEERFAGRFEVFDTTPEFYSTLPPELRKSGPVADASTGAYVPIGTPPVDVASLLDDMKAGGGRGYPLGR